MSSLSGRSRTLTPTDDPHITFVDGKPILSKPTSQDGSAWQNYKEGQCVHMEGPTSTTIFMGTKASHTMDSL
eukprot:507750-Prorocentrum_lima.AAC.1